MDERAAFLGTQLTDDSLRIDIESIFWLPVLGQKKYATPISKPPLHSGRYGVLR